MSDTKGYLICIKCGKRTPQSVYDSDVNVVCGDCHKKMTAVEVAESTCNKRNEP